MTQKVRLLYSPISRVIVTFEAVYDALCIVLSNEVENFLPETSQSKNAQVCACERITCSKQVGKESARAKNICVRDSVRPKRRYQSGAHSTPRCMLPSKNTLPRAHSMQPTPVNTSFLFLATSHVVFCTGRISAFFSLGHNSGFTWQLFPAAQLYVLSELLNNSQQ